MKKYFIQSFLILSICFFSFSCSKKIDTDKKKASYALGQVIGKNYKNQNIVLDTDIFIQAIKDASSGKSELTEDEIQTALRKLQESTQKKNQEMSGANKTASQEFLEKNKSEQGVKTTSSGLQYKIIKEGDGQLPIKGDVIKCHYVGTLTNGDKFDSSMDRGKPAVFPIESMPAGWKEALELMKVGSKYKFFIPPELAYGNQSRPGIPANSVIILDIELLEILKK